MKTTTHTTNKKASAKGTNMKSATTVKRTSTKRPSTNATAAVAAGKGVKGTTSTTSAASSAGEVEGGALSATKAAGSPLTASAITAYVTQVIAALDAFEAQLGSDPPLSPVEKRHAAKFRKRGVPLVPQIANLAVQNNLESPSMQTSTMTDSLAQAQAFTPLVNRLGQFQQHVSDLVFVAENASWVSTLQFYGLLKQKARGDATLKAALAPIVASFAYRNPATKTPSTLTKPQRKAAAKATATLKRLAPSPTQAGASAGTPVAAPVAPATPPAH